MKILAIVIFLVIVGSLANALYHLVKSQNGDESGKIVKALTLRISLSVILFILLFIAFATGMFEPHGIGARMEQIRSEQTATPNP